MLKRPAILAALAAVATAIAFAIAVMPSAHAATPVRIMALGDSITGSPGCWRALLWNRLQDNGYTDIDMVGTLPAQGCGVAYDGENEGHGGFLVTSVADQNQLVGWLAATLPDIVVMHFGTNDVWSNRSTQQILDAYSKLVDQMRASNANMKILVAKIIPVAPPTCTECPARTVALNDAIPGWAASKTTAASPITVVDQWTGWVPGTHTYDGVHPNAAGDQRMSDNWYPTLAAAISGTEPPVHTTAPTVPGTPSVSGIVASRVNLTWSASTDNVAVTGYDIYRAPGSSGGTFASIGTSTGASYISTGLSPSTTYRFQVRARDAAGNTSAFSPAVTVTTASGGDVTAPTVPGAPTASSVTSSSVALSWSPSTDNVGVVGYDIYRAPGSSGGTFASVGTSTGTSFSNSGLSASTTYRYQVRARDAVGNVSTFSSAVTVTTLPGGGGSGCTATYSTTNSWPGGFQGDVTVTNNGSTPTTSWSVVLTFPNGQAITQVWNARTTSTSSPYTITNESYNGTIGANASASFGFLGSWSGTNGTPTLTCTA